MLDAGSSFRTQEDRMPTTETSWSPPRAVEPIHPISFPPTPWIDVFNASEVVALADSRFLFCDNNVTDSLVEMVFGPDGTLAEPLIRRPIQGLPEGGVDDMECMALVEHENGRTIFASPSLSNKIRKGFETAPERRDRAKPAPARAGLLRIDVHEDDSLHAELIPDFRDWFVANSPKIGESAEWTPDDSGLNVEGLSWDPTSNALIFGIRTPVPHGHPMLVRVKIKDLAAPWKLENLKMLDPVQLKVDVTGDEMGVRSIEYDPTREASLVVLANSTSESDAPFLMFLWDGNDKGKMHQFEDIWFTEKMRVEGVAPGTVDGRRVIVFVDDRGGYQIIWNEDPRLEKQSK
ncbi:DUF3616 domain-containing protein [Pseudonocardia sp. CA-142604]|uniref:DUF3616 domain-containing protein n=1 Tax=Pseudonocardia sp. CA-142604 TaxID=3240024 RepID=UPI003D905A7D